MREALELVISGAAPRIKPSLYELHKDLFVNLRYRGPRDLSTKRKHLDHLGK